jgi:hypothetical protein
MSLLVLAVLFPKDSVTTGFEKQWKSCVAASVLMLMAAAPLCAQADDYVAPSFWNVFGSYTGVIFILLGIAAGILCFSWWRNKQKARPHGLSLRPDPPAEVESAPRPAQKIESDARAPVLYPPAVPVVPAQISTQISTPSTAPASAARPIFISYRRQDSQHITGRIYDRLISQFGKEAVFKDVDSIPLGYDFRDHLREQVGRCAVLVAVIGKSWNPPAASGDRRLSDPRDHLRIEIESALERRIPVIPVLVDGVEVPAEEELPASLGRLAYHNGVAVRPDPDFHHDADRLVRGIEALMKQAPR